MIVETNSEQGIIIWQKSEQEMPEDALLIQDTVHGYIEIQQQQRYVLINHESIADLIKALKIIQKANQ